MLVVYRDSRSYPPDSPWAWVHNANPYTFRTVSLFADGMHASNHWCKPTCRCGYFYEIVYDVRACNMCDVKTELWIQLIFASRKYELSPPFSLTASCRLHAWTSYTISLMWPHRQVGSPRWSNISIASSFSRSVKCVTTLPSTITSIFIWGRFWFSV